MIGEGVEEEEEEYNLEERERGGEGWTMTRGSFIDGEDERSAQSISHLLYYPITFYARWIELSRQLSHPSSSLLPLASSTRDSPRG